MFAEVILPLPLYSTFTYSVPEEMEAEVQVGVRVIIQFGKKKFFTGIIESFHSQKPSGYEVKPIVCVLDKSPIIKYPQLNFWKWIAEYYLCSLGEVFKAALPTGLKPESETFISINPDYEATDSLTLSLNDKEALIYQILLEQKRLKIADIEKETGLKNISYSVNRLLEEGIIEISEHLAEIYRPKKISIVELNLERGEQEKLHDFFSLVSRSERQEKLLVAYLDLSNWLNQSKELKLVEKADLLKATGASSGILKAMVDKGIFKIIKKSVNRFTDNLSKTTEDFELSSLSVIQNRALKEIEREFLEKNIVLFHGVTGSGKTEVYTHLIAKTLKEGNQALFLVPEISLTTQLSDRLKKVFGEKLLVYHSKFSDSERVDLWKKLLSTTQPVVVLGARSSIFLPFSRLGLIIVDEEHETSFKQYDPAPRYNARDAAMMLAKMHGAKSLLGSATPSVETYFKASSGKYGLVTLSERYEGATLPDVEIIDLKEMRKKKEMSGIFSSPLRNRLMKTLSEKKQSIIFQNRRGFAPVVVCDQCAWTPKCQNCDVSLVFHKNSGLLKCHYCGYSRPLPALCPACGQNGIKVFGYGTERIAEELEKMLPEAKVQRMDLDTTRNKMAYQEIIEDFACHNTDILIGTQMVSKGLDFGDVKTVGVVNADTLLNMPDFRSNEKAFNMLEQVAGRAGRRDETGTVMIQTVNPENPVLEFVKKHDYTSYYQTEILDREKYNYPPFTKIINIYIKNKDSMLCDKAAVMIALQLRKLLGDRVLGPEKPLISKISNFYYQCIMIKVEKSASMKKIKDILRHILAVNSMTPEIKSSVIYYDVDPV